MLKNLEQYNFTDFKHKKKYPKAKYVYPIMLEFEKEEENIKKFKKKLKTELGFKEGDKGITYPTLIKYLALALEELETLQL